MMEGGDINLQFPPGFVGQPNHPQQPEHQQPIPYGFAFSHQDFQFRPSNGFDPNVEKWDIRELAAIFLKSYYQLWETGPQYMYRWHGKESEFTHGEGRTVKGLEEIKERLEELSYHNCIAEINYYDAYEGADKAISIMVIGKMTNNEGPWRPFAQMLVLNLSTPNSRKYYVRTDVFKYLDSLFPELVQTSLSPSTMYNYQQHPQFQPKYPPPPTPGYAHCPYSYLPHPHPMYVPEISAAFASFAYGHVPQHLFQSHPLMHPPPHIPSASFSMQDLLINNDVDTPLTAVIDDRNIEQNEIINNAENKEEIEQHEMSNMIHTNEAVTFERKEVFLEKGSQMPEPEPSFQTSNYNYSSLKPNDMQQQYPIKAIFQNEVTSLSKESSISSTSLPSLASPTLKFAKSPPSPSSDPSIMDNCENDIPVISLIIENSNNNKQKLQQDQDEKLEVGKKKQVQPASEPFNSNHLTNGHNDMDKDTPLLNLEAFPLYDPKSKQQTGNDYKYNTVVGKKATLSYKDKVMAAAPPPPPPKQHHQPKFSPKTSSPTSPKTVKSSSTISIKASTSQISSNSSAGFANKNNDNNNNKNQRNNYNNSQQRNNYNNQRNNNNNNNANNNNNNNQRNNYSKSNEKDKISNNNTTSISTEKIPEDQLSFQPAKTEEEALQMIYSYPDKYQIFVGNLPTHINDDGISKLFSSFGEIIAIKIKKPHMNHAPSTPFCAFLVFKTEDAVQAVLKSIEEKHMFMPLGEGRPDRRLNIEAKQTRPRQFNINPRPYQQTTWKRRADYGNANNNSYNNNNNNKNNKKE